MVARVWGPPRPALAPILFWGDGTAGHRELSGLVRSPEPVGIRAGDLPLPDRYPCRLVLRGQCGRADEYGSGDPHPKAAGCPARRLGSAEPSSRMARRDLPDGVRGLSGSRDADPIPAPAGCGQVAE